MKNGTLSNKLRMQEQELKIPEQDFAGEKRNIDTSIQQQISTPVNQSTNNLVSHSEDGNGLSSLFSILPSSGDIGYGPNPEDEQPLRPKKKKKRRPRIS